MKKRPRCGKEVSTTKPPNQSEGRQMIDAFEEMCIWVYVVLDDLYREMEMGGHRRGPQPQCSDSELLTIIVVSECKGWENETEWYYHWYAYRSLFRHFPERTRLNRRRRALTGILNQMRFKLLQRLEAQLESRCILDSFPIEVVQFGRVPQSTGDWWQHQAAYGYNPTTQRHFFGYKLYLLVTLTGMIVDFMLAPANVDERVAADELLDPYTDLLILADKGFVSQQWCHDLATRNRITLLTDRRDNQHARLPKPLRRWLHTHRQRVETVFSQCAHQFHLHSTLARSFSGFATRLVAKLSAHTCSCFIRLAQGHSDWLRIKRFAFPSL